MSKISESETTKTDQHVEASPLLETKTEEVEKPLNSQNKVQESVDTIPNASNGKDINLSFN